ncbi:MAG: flagellar export protein FliJ [Acidimicrobiales bacterium]
MHDDVGTGGDDEPVSVTPEARALLTRLAAEGSDAVFDQRFGGELDAAGEAGPYVFAGRSGDQAIVYVCDGTSGTWFTGTVDGAGAGTLRSTVDDATVTLGHVDDGLTTSFEGGAFAGRSTTAAPLDVAEAELVRLEAAAAAGGPDAAVGGIIITPSGVRGVLRTSITDGTSNKLIIPRTPTTTTTRPPGAITDGDSNTIGIAETPTTTTTRPPGGISDGNSNTIGIAETPTTTTTISTATTGTPGAITDGNSNTIGIGETPASGATTTVTTTGTPGAITDGNSNTIGIGETPATTTTIPTATTGAPRAITDGNANTIGMGERSTTTTTNGAPLADGGASGLGTTPGTRPAKGTIVSRTATGVLTVQLVTSTSAAPTTASASAPCAAELAVLDDLLRALTATQSNLQHKVEMLGAQRDEVAAQLSTVAGTERAALQEKLDRLDGTLTKVQRQLDRVATQVDDVRKQAASCPTGASASK